MCSVEMQKVCENAIFHWKKLLVYKTFVFQKAVEKFMKVKQSLHGVKRMRLALRCLRLRNKKSKKRKKENVAANLPMF